jgi:hypothetical protein
LGAEAGPDVAGGSSGGRTGGTGRTTAVYAVAAGNAALLGLLAWLFAGLGAAVSLLVSVVLAIRVLSAWWFDGLWARAWLPNPRLGFMVYMNLLVMFAVGFAAWLAPLAAWLGGSVSRRQWAGGARETADSFSRSPARQSLSETESAAVYGDDTDDRTI